MQEKLTPQPPPRHVPWTSDKPVSRREWISEGSIFPAETIHSWTSKKTPPGMAQPFANWPSKITTPHSAQSIRDDTDSAVILKECSERQTGSKLSVHAFESALSISIHGRKEKWAQRASDSPILKPCSNKTTNQLVPICGDVSLPLPQLGSIPSLAVRRGKMVSGLQLKEVDDLKYPDLPTPLRSPTIWSPKFDPGILSPDEELFTDHQIMLSNLRSQYAALASGISTPTTYEIKELQPASMDSDMYSVTSKPSSLSDDEWAFEKDLVVATEDLQGVDNTPDILPPSSMPRIVPDRSRNSLDDRYSGCVSLTRSALPPRSWSEDMKISPASPNGLPRDTAPSCPVLINTFTPPCAKSILKTVKSVRFEDVRRSQDAGFLVPPARESSTAARRPSPLRNSFTAPLSATDANKSGTKTGPKPKGDRVPVMKSCIMKSKLVPRVRLRRVSEVPILASVDTNVRHKVPSAPRLDKPTTSTIGRHSHGACADKENGRNAPTHARKPWSTTNENNLGISVDDGAYKNRLTPLRNIFKFN